jgi:hypothetical protein
MALLAPALARTLGTEGGYSNDPVDRGGETYRGVSRVMHPEWSGWLLIDMMKKKAKPGDFPHCLDSYQSIQLTVTEFYLTEFWSKMALDSCQSQAIANELFDTAVNMGPKWAKAFYRRALNVLNRGGSVFADLPEGAGWMAYHDACSRLLGRGDERVLLVALNVLQGARYIDLMEHDPSQERFARGWLLQRVALNP